MPYAITYTENVIELKERAIALATEGKWPQYLRLTEDNLKLTMVKVDTAYAKDSPRSLCMIMLPLIDILGDEEDESYVKFVDDVGLIVLSYGNNRGDNDTCPYKQIKTGSVNLVNPDALALYESVLPPIELLDEDENPTGETRFNQWIEFDT